jgi:hypothetical protein
LQKQQAERGFCVSAASAPLHSTPLSLTSVSPPLIFCSQEKPCCRRNLLSSTTVAEASRSSSGPPHEPLKLLAPFLHCWERIAESCLCAFQFDLLPLASPCSTSAAAAVHYRRRRRLAPTAVLPPRPQSLAGRFQVRGRFNPDSGFCPWTTGTPSRSAPD